VGLGDSLNEGCPVIQGTNTKKETFWKAFTMFWKKKWWHHAVTSANFWALTKALSRLQAFTCTKPLWSSRMPISMSQTRSEDEGSQITGLRSHCESMAGRDVNVSFQSLRLLNHRCLDFIYIYIYICFETGSRYAAQTVLQLLIWDPLASHSRALGITGMHHQVQLLNFFDLTKSSQLFDHTSSTWA
jgi:hypothetical protein